MQRTQTVRRGFGRWPRIIVAAGILVAVVALGVWPLIPPSALPADAPEEVFSAERAAAHIDVIASRPHPIGSPANQEVRAYLVSELRGLGLEPVLQSIEVPDYFGRDGTVTVVNVMARIQGYSNTGAVALMGHYDSTPSTPGANDNAAAVAAILETARALLAGPELRNDFILLLTDGEEPAPRFGATAFADGHQWADDIAFVANFEAIGGTGPSVLIETSGADSWVVGNVVSAAQNPVAFSFYTSLVDLVGADATDFTPLRNRGIVGANFAYLHGSTIYHTAADSPDHVDLRSVQHHGQYALSIAKQLGDVDFAEIPEGAESTYFRAAPFLVIYPQSWVLPLASLVAALFAAAVVLRVRRKEVAPLSFLVGAGKLVLVVLGAGVFVALAWMLIIAIRPTPSVIESYAYMIVLLAVIVSALSWVLRRLERKHSNLDLISGAVLIWALLSLLCALAMPGGSYLFTWPALAGVIVVGLMFKPDDRRLRLTSLTVFAVPALLLSIPVVDLLFQLAMPRPGNPDSELVAAIAVPAMIAALVLLPLVAVASGTAAREQGSTPELT